MRNWDKEYVLEDLLKENIFSLDRGRVISSIDIAKCPGIFPVYSSSVQKNGLFGYYDKFDFDEELITWSVDGGGYFFYRPKHKFSVTNVSGILKINKPELFDYKFLYYNLAFQHASQYYDYSDKAHPSVIKKRYLIPEISLSEQQTIASILSKLDKTITQTVQLIDKYKNIKEGLMHDLLTKGIGNEDFELISTDLKNIEVKSSFHITTLKAITKVRQGYQIEISSRKKEEGENRFVYITVQYINNPKKYLEYIENPPLEVISKYDDILFTRTGNTGQIVTNIVGVYHNNFFKVDFDRKLISKDYLLLFLQWEPVKGLILELAGTTTIPDLKHKDFYSIPIFFPKTLEEQNTITASINKVNEVVEEYETELSKLESLKSGLMHDLLTGKVRVSNCEEQKEQSSNVNVVLLKIQAHNHHIEDAVLIGAIVNAFYSDKYILGRKKIQKLLYLVRRHQEASVACFKKKAAGPYADEIRYKGGEPIAKNNKYITTKSNTLGTAFSKGENIEKALVYIEKWEMLSDINWLLTQFKYTKVDQLELIATIDMARCDLEKEEIPVSLSSIKHLIATNEEWKAKLKKDYFDDFSIQRGIDESYKLFGE